MELDLKKTFLAGLLIFVPLAVTVYVLFAVFELLDGILRPFIVLLIGRVAGSELYIPGISLLVLLAGITLLGAFARLTVGAQAVAFFESLLMRIPVVKGLYSTVKYASSALISQKDTGYIGVVLVEYPRKGMYAVGLTTAVGVKEIQDKTKAKMINVFVPTSPNPTSGFLLMVPEDEVIPLDMSIDDGLKLVVSGGFSNMHDDPQEPSKV
ncbi:MAG: DUF502 domain-containing protein [Methanobacteriota archaeon]|nr:MAG: DUF502 domain-containing protein [Euryarchaeota archaeon]